MKKGVHLLKGLALENTENMGAPLRRAKGDQTALILERAQSCEVLFTKRSPFFQRVLAVSAP